MSSGQKKTLEGGAVGKSSKVVKEFGGIARMLIIHTFVPWVFQDPKFVAKVVFTFTGTVPWLARVLTANYEFSMSLSPFIVLFCLKPFRVSVGAILGRKRGVGSTEVSKISGAGPGRSGIVTPASRTAKSNAHM